MGRRVTRRWLAAALAAVVVVGALLGARHVWQQSGPAVPPEDGGEAHAEARRQMVEAQIRQRGVTDRAVLRVMEAVPRHVFVPAEHLRRAYGDHPLPIGYGQTISQPFIVAIMTEVLRPEAGHRVLEVGTGSGYQAAVLAELGVEVYTVEIVPELCAQAGERLADMGHDGVHILCGDGYYGWEEHAPYDGIIVTCAPDHIPQPLVNQLADGGRMVIPVGPPGSYQVLWLIERDGEDVRSERILDVTFVPLTGGPH